MALVPEPSSKSARQRWLFPAILMLTALILFANTFNGGFTYDDVSVVGNPQIKYWHFWDLWGVTGRSMRTLSLMADYHLFGNFPTG